MPANILPWDFPVPPPISQLLQSVPQRISTSWHCDLPHYFGNTLLGQIKGLTHTISSFYTACKQKIQTNLGMRGISLLLTLGACGVVSWIVYMRWRRRLVLQPGERIPENSQHLDRGPAPPTKRNFPPKNRSNESMTQNGTDGEDPGLLRKNSAYLSYTAAGNTYPSIRTFFRPHPHLDKFPSDQTPLPLLVFVHGLGGSLAQFNPLITTLTNVASCFGIDFPGCGLSSFLPPDWGAYSIESLAELLAKAIEKHRNADRGQGVVLIAHSLGTAICNLLVSPVSPVAAELKDHIVGFVPICPVAEPPPSSQVSSMRRLLYIPGPVFNLFRMWDRRGGVNSPSVSRFVGSGADLETRKLQLRFNGQSRTPVWRRMAWGSLPKYDDEGKPTSGIPGRQAWNTVSHKPILLVAGESDPVTKASNVYKLLQFMKADSASSERNSSLTPGHLLDSDLDTLKTFIFPAPVSHALLYDRSTYRALSGVIQDFLAHSIDERLGLGWQLQHLSSSGKWDVKNLAKWQAVQPVSDPIGAIFVAMKTLRGVDTDHCPELFSRAWKGKIYAVIDISHDNPVYDPAQLEKGGIRYHKFPTVSKIPPMEDEVRDFISLVDRLRDEISHETPRNGKADESALLGVHCHYGYNRTGFFMASYLIEKCGYTVQEALDEFEKRRPPGIRHEHFIDNLFVRYCI